MAIPNKEVIDTVDEPKPIKYPVKVKNIHTNSICLASGIIKPGEEGKATQAEVSNFLTHYLELV
jgi:hypothetical protein